MSEHYVVRRGRGKKNEYLRLSDQAVERTIQYLESWSNKNRPRFSMDEWMDYGRANRFENPIQWIGSGYGGTQISMLRRWYFLTKADIADPTTMLKAIIEVAV